MVLVYPFLGPYELSTKKVYLSPSGAKRVLMWIVLYFSGLRRLNCMKNHPLESSSDFSYFQNYENTNRNLLIRAHKIHKSMTCQALYSPLFNLVKNEERLELNFLDSLKLNKNYKQEFLSLVINSGSMSSLNKTLSQLSDNHVLVYTSSSAITSMV